MSCGRFQVYFGPLVPYVYRLHGPNRWHGAREAIMSVDERVFKVSHLFNKNEPIVFLTISSALACHFTGDEFIWIQAELWNVWIHLRLSHCYSPADFNFLDGLIYIELDSNGCVKLRNDIFWCVMFTYHLNIFSIVFTCQLLTKDEFSTDFA